MKDEKRRYLNDDEVLSDNFDDCAVVEDVAIDHSPTKRSLLLWVKLEERSHIETQQDPLSIFRIQSILSCLFE